MINLAVVTQNEQAIILELLEAALSYARRGWPVIPLWWPLPGGRCACGSPDCDKPGKHPLIKEWTQRGATDEATIHQWWERWPDANVGIVTGEKSGILLLDVDLKDDGPGHLAGLENNHGKLPDTVEAITGSGGRHVLFKYPQGRVITNKARFAPGLDTRSTGGMFVAAPSLHNSGRRYEWELSSHPDDVPLADAPGWLLDLMEMNNKQQKGNVRSVEGPIPKGQRNAALASLAGTMRRRGMGEAEILVALMSVNERCIPPLSEREVKAIAGSIAKYSPTDVTDKKNMAEIAGPNSFNLTDLGNARRLVERYGDSLRYCHAWGRWLVYDRSRWTVDETDNITRYAKATVRGIYEEAAAAITDSLRKDLARHAMRSESEGRIKAMISLAESEPGIPVMPVQLDNNPWLFNCLNGTVNLKTGELQEHGLRDYITKQAPVDYDPGAECPTWTGFLNQVMGGNEQLTGFLQKAIGYSLTGDVSEQVLFILHGSGSNGKSTFLNAVLSLLSKYGIQAEPNLLMSKNPNTHPTALTDLMGCRMAVCAETSAGRKFDEELVKQLTGGEKIRARRMRQDFFEFPPTHKLWIATNHKPVIEGTDNAIWRRIRLIPFAVTIKDTEKDKSLPDKLVNELPGILAWAVQGCLLWQQEGLDPPDEVKKATDSYKAEMDVIAAFIDECCIEKDFAKASAGDLYKKYCDWCGENGERAESQKAFGMRLTERGFARTRGTAGRIVWEGIGLTDYGKQ